MNNPFHFWLSKNAPRWVNKLYANLNGYFWLPCDCGRYFGGHEWFSGNTVMDDEHGGHGICPKCGEKKKQISLKELTVK